ncbi:MAG: hypothetical protein ABR525_05845 [Candidatus Limnocylindria bacterium]
MARLPVPPAHRTPRIRSMSLLRAIAAAITLVSFGGMTAYAVTHVQNPDAPLKPALAAAPTPTATATPATRGRTRLTPGVSVTGQAPLTRTRTS